MLLKIQAFYDDVENKLSINGIEPRDGSQQYLNDLVDEASTLPCRIVELAAIPRPTSAVYAASTWYPVHCTTPISNTLY